MKKTLILGTAVAAAAVMTGCSIRPVQTKYGSVPPLDEQVIAVETENGEEMTESMANPYIPLEYGPAPKADGTYSDRPIADVYGPAVPEEGRRF